jgi:hypothetical protein
VIIFCGSVQSTNIPATCAGLTMSSSSSSALCIVDMCSNTGKNIYPRAAVTNRIQVAEVRAYGLYLPLVDRRRIAVR